MALEGHNCNLVQNLSIILYLPLSKDVVMKYLLVIAVLLSFTAPVKAGQVELTSIVWCGDWLDARSKLTNTFDQDGARNRVSMVAEGVLRGFLNGLVWSLDTDFWRITQLKHNQIFYWMDKYCRDNPLNDIYMGAIQLFREGVEN